MTTPRTKKGLAASNSSTAAFLKKLGLIRDGETLVYGASHILDDLGELPFARKASAAEPAAAIPELPPEEAAVFAAITADESPVDRIIERSGLPAHVVTATLMKLELRRLVRAFPGFRYARR